MFAVPENTIALAPAPYSAHPARIALDVAADRARWAGLLDSTTDEHPIVDAVPTLPQMLVVCGLSGHGMPFGLRFGQLLSEAVVNGTLPLALKPRGDRE